LRVGGEVDVVLEDGRLVEMLRERLVGEQFDERLGEMLDERLGEMDPNMLQVNFRQAV
jgi:aromatic ring-cleaving dioxygenase